MKKLVESHAHYKRVYEILQDFLPLAMNVLKLSGLPKIKVSTSINSGSQPSFGIFGNNGITICVKDRHPIDICRTLAHELVHFKQKQRNLLHSMSGKTGSKEENQANSIAGIIMRRFNKEFPQHLV